MKKLFFVMMILCSAFCFAGNVQFSVRETGVYARTIEDLEYTVSVEIYNTGYGYTTLSVRVQPFSKYSFSMGGSDRDYSSGLELEVKEDLMGIGSNTTKYYTAKIKKDYEVLLEKKFRFIVGARGVSVVNGHY